MVTYAKYCKGIPGKIVSRIYPGASKKTTWFDKTWGVVSNQFSLQTPNFVFGMDFVIFKFKAYRYKYYVSILYYEDDQCLK